MKLLETRGQSSDDLNALLDALPPRIAQALRSQRGNRELLEVVLDLGRVPEARYPGEEQVLSDSDIIQEDLDYLASRVGEFNDDNRAGIERTLHRISAIRNRQGRIVGITCRVGRAISGTAGIIQDLVESGKSILLLGRPGVGKTTMLREVARVLADDMSKRVIVVDTSNEIAGDGDIPHPAIGHARRMQVPMPLLQHRVMIEAVENHMPEVIIIDEIGTEAEAAAARTIAERGVQLIATAHGNALDNLIMNPTLSDLIGGIQSVTLGDVEARRRRTQKSILERKAPPTFEVLVELQSWELVSVHADVALTVDIILRGGISQPSIRRLSPEGEVQEIPAGPPAPAHTPDGEVPPASTLTDIYPFGVSRSRLEQGIRSMNLPIRLVDQLEQADILLTTKQQFRRRAQPLHSAQATGVPVYVLRKNSPLQIDQALGQIAAKGEDSALFTLALEEAEQGIEQIQNGETGEVELSPQSAPLRRLQHQLANQYNLASRSSGREPYRRVRLYRLGD